MLDKRPCSQVLSELHMASPGLKGW